MRERGKVESNWRGGIMWNITGKGMEGVEESGGVTKEWIT